MKKMITLGLIACASLISSTTFGMLMRQLPKRTKIAVPQKKYTTGEIIFLTKAITKLKQENALLQKEIAATELINQDREVLIKNTTETPKEPQHKLREMEDHQLSKYQQDMNRYHSSKQSPE